MQFQSPSQSMLFQELNGSVVKKALFVVMYKFILYSNYLFNSCAKVATIFKNHFERIHISFYSVNPYDLRCKIAAHPFYFNSFIHKFCSIHFCILFFSVLEG